MKKIVNPFSPECEYWVAMNGFAWGIPHLPDPSMQVGADSIHRTFQENNVAHTQLGRALTKPLT